MATAEFTFNCKMLTKNDLVEVPVTGIIEIARNGEQGWFMSWQTDIDDGQIQRGSGHTNEAGNGWWDDANESQIKGTSQYSLPKNAKSALYKLVAEEAKFRSPYGYENLKITYNDLE